MGQAQTQSLEFNKIKTTYQNNLYYKEIQHTTKNVWEETLVTQILGMIINK